MTPQEIFDASVGALLITVAVLKALPAQVRKHGRLLRCLQDIYAAEEGKSRLWLESFRVRARAVAKDFGLSPAILDQEPQS